MRLVKALAGSGHLGLPYEGAANISDRNGEKRALLWSREALHSGAKVGQNKQRRS